VIPIDVRDASEIERALVGFEHEPNGGFIVAATRLAGIHRELIITLAARYRLPAVYPYRFFAASGGLISYGRNQVQQYRLAASYIDRILRGEKAADLPVQAPSKYETVINLKTAKAHGLTIPETLLATADEVIIVGLGGAAAWPVVARAQQGGRVRRIGVLLNAAAIEVEHQGFLAAFVQEMRRLGWSEGQNLRMEVRWNAGDAVLSRTYAAELIGLRADCFHGQPQGGSAAYENHTDRVRVGRRSAYARFRIEYASAGRKYNRLQFE
jgi:hypothetical protein